MSSTRTPSREELERRWREAEERLDNLQREHDAVQAREAHIKQVLLAVRNVNQLIVQETDPARLIQRTCEHLVETLGYECAWIAVLNENGDAASATGAAGFSGQFDPMREQLLRGEFPECMKAALGRDGCYVSEDPAQGCLDCPVAGVYGGRAGLAHRLCSGGEVFGVLAVSMPVGYVYDEEEQGLFREVTGDVAFALQKLKAEQAARDSEGRFRSLVEGSPDVIVRFDRDMRHQYVSPSVFEFCGLPSDTFIGRTVQEIDIPDDLRAFVADRLTHVFETGEPCEAEYEGETPKGWMVMNWRLLPECGNGSVASVLAIVRDITDHRKAEENYERLFEQMLDGFALHEIILDAQGRPVDYRFLAVNPAFERMTGLKAEDVIGRTALDVLPQTESHWIETYGRVALTGEPVSFESHSKEIGRRFEVSAFRPAPNQFACIFIDVTQRCEAEEALRESTERYRLLAENTADAIWLMGLDTTIQYVNPASHSILGYAPEEMIGTSLSAYCDEENLARMAGVMQEALATPEDRRPVTLECAMRHRSGAAIPVEITGRVVLDETGQPVAVQGLARDIAERKRAEEALRDALMNQQEAVRAANVGLWRWDLKTNAVIYSAEWKRQIGYEEDEIPNDWEEWRSRVHPDDLEAALRRVEKTLTAKDVHYYNEFRFRHKDGSYRWILAQATIYRDEAGNPLRVLGSHLDITRLKLVEEELRENERQYRTLYEQAPVGIFTSSSTGHLLSLNPTMARMIGARSPEDAVRHYVDVGRQLYAQPERRAEFLRLLQEKGRVENFAFEANTMDGRTAWFEMTARIAERDEDGAFAIEGFLSDVTQRKRAERERERLIAAIEQCGEVVVITDVEGDIQYVNPAFETVTGYSPEEVKGKNPRILKSGKQDDAFYRDLWGTVSSGGTWQGQMVNRRKDGSFYTEKATISPVRDATGRIANYVAVKEDVTAQLLLQEQYQQAQKMESIGRLAGGVAHDFNNMLNVIIGHSEMVMQDLGAAHPLYGDVGEIHKAADRSAGLTRQLLAFARKQIVSPKVLDLNETVEGMLKMLRRLIGEDIDLVWAPRPGLPTVKMDSTQLDHILANLCVNARDAIRGVGKVTIETAWTTFDKEYCEAHIGFLPGEYVMLAVSDDGCGMDAEAQSHLFEPFYTTKGVGKGTGLGLATVYGAVKQSKGFINVYSEPGEGTTFRLYFPRHAAGTGVASKDEPAQQRSAANVQATVLIVEDEPSILSLGKKMLENLGYRVLSAATPGEAIAVAQEHAGDIDLLLTDVVMPEMNGRDLAKQIMSLYPDVKRLFMSGYTANVIAHHGVLDEGVHFIQKPFSLGELSAKLSAALRD